MSVARVTMVDYVSEEAADKFEPDYKIICQKALPEADSLILIRTGPTSGLSVAIYRDEELAEAMLPRRQAMLEQFTDVFKDFFHLEGPVSLHYINELLLDNFKRST